MGDVGVWDWFTLAGWGLALFASVDRLLASIRYKATIADLKKDCSKLASERDAARDMKAHIAGAYDGCLVRNTQLQTAFDNAAAAHHRQSEELRYKLASAIERAESAERELETESGILEDAKNENERLYKPLEALEKMVAEMGIILANVKK